MTTEWYDEEESARLHMDIVYDVAEPDADPQATWVAARRRLNAISDPLARKLIALHEDCGSGTGECDDSDGPPAPWSSWGCETTSTIASHFAINYR